MSQALKTLLGQFIKHDDATTQLGQDLKAMYKKRDDALQAALPIFVVLKGFDAAKVLTTKGTGRVVWNSKVRESSKTVDAARKQLDRLLEKAYGKIGVSNETDPKAKRIAAFRKAAAALSWSEFDGEVKAINATR